MFEPVSIGFCTGFALATGCSAAHRKSKKKDPEKIDDQLCKYPNVKYDIIEPSYTLRKM